jgi:hypothetical protein
MLDLIRQFLSKPGKSMKRSVKEEILKHLRKPLMISCAGRLHSPGIFPVDEFADK